MKYKWFQYLVIPILISSCSLLSFDNIETRSKEILIKQPGFSIGWDYNYLGLTDKQIANIIFNVYVKKPNESSWSSLGKTSGKNPFFTINSSILSPGRYAFAVTANIAGQESEMHTSEDNTADPIGGWHVLWIPTE